MKRDMPTFDEESISHETPERNLWFAVIERALKDYCFFFDKLIHSGTGQLITYESLNFDNKNNFQIKAIYEFNRLRWFLFDKEPAQFNLAYLADQLYEDGDGAASSIRKEASRQFKLHFNQAEERGHFMAVIHYIKENTNVMIAEAADKQSALRNKRHRLGG
jgi:hypothetical protein